MVVDELLLDAPAQKNDTASPRPSRELQPVLDALPALPGILPPVAAGHALNGPFYVLCQAQPEQIGQAPCLAPAHQRIRGEALIPTQQRWPAVPSYAIEKRPQSGNGMIGCVLVARHHLDVEDEPHSPACSYDRRGSGGQASSDCSRAQLPPDVPRAA